MPWRNNPLKIVKTEINLRSVLLYKSLDLKSKLPNMSEAEMLELLSSDGMLVKRPLIIGEDLVLVGFKESEYGKI